MKLFGKQFSFLHSLDDKAMESEIKCCQPDNEDRDLLVLLKLVWSYVDKQGQYPELCNSHAITQSPFLPKCGCSEIEDGEIANSSDESDQQKQQPKKSSKKSAKEDVGALCQGDQGRDLSLGSIVVMAC